MASLARLGLFWGDDKITVVEFEKNTPTRVAFSALSSKTDSPSPLSSNLTEEIQITEILKKILQDNRITGGDFYVSLPMKEIILRSFAIPFVKAEGLQNTIKYEAKKFVPFDIQDLSYVYYTTPFTEGQNKRLQVIFFAARKEVLLKYDRIFRKVNATVSYIEPYIVSLSKILLFKKDIKATDHFAFLVLDKNLGRICFINKGIPQFIREFPVISPFQSEEAGDSTEALRLKIVNEVGNSFDFYSRQFTGGSVEQVLVTTELVIKDLIEALVAELKIKVSKFSPEINTVLGQSNDMDAVYAMGACVPPPIDSLSKFNFIEDKTSKSALQNQTIAAFKPYQNIIITFLICAFFLIGVYVFLQMQLKITQDQYNRLSAKEGAFWNETSGSIQTEIQQNVNKLNQFKSIKTNSHIASIILRIASHLPQGTLLNTFDIKSNQDASGNNQMLIDINGMVVSGDFKGQIAVVNQMFADFKNDKELGQFIKHVDLVFLNRVMYNDRQVTGFTIHFS